MKTTKIFKNIKKTTATQLDIILSFMLLGSITISQVPKLNCIEHYKSLLRHYGYNSCTAQIMPVKVTGTTGNYQPVYFNLDKDNKPDITVYINGNQENTKLIYLSPKYKNKGLEKIFE